MSRESVTTHNKDGFHYYYYSNERSITKVELIRADGQAGCYFIGLSAVSVLKLSRDQGFDLLLEFIEPGDWSEVDWYQSTIAAELVR